MKYLRISTLDKGYCDKDFLMLHACFQLLVDYVEKEDPFERIDWEHSPEHSFAAKEIKDLYKWWKEVDQDNLDFFPGSKEEEDSQKNLERLIKIRGFLWT